MTYILISNDFGTILFILLWYCWNIFPCICRISPILLSFSDLPAGSDTGIVWIRCYRSADNRHLQNLSRFSGDLSRILWPDVIPPFLYHASQNMNVITFKCNIRNNPFFFEDCFWNRPDTSSASQHNKLFIPDIRQPDFFHISQPRIFMKREIQWFFHQFYRISEHILRQCTSNADIPFGCLSAI